MKRPHALEALPGDYSLFKNLDLIKERKLLLFLSLVSLIIFVASWMGLFLLLILLRPDVDASAVSFSFTLSQPGSILLPLLVLIGVIFAMVILHEAIHGLFFRLFTGGQVDFAFKGAYAYAAAPGWFVYKTPYLLISLAPLVLITIFGFSALLFVPVGWINPLMLLVAMNASGAVGDIYVFILLARMPGDVLVRDFGERMEIYARTDESSGL